MTYFIRNRHGSITIMLVAILVAAIFLNSTLLEIGRYKAVSDIVGEIQENAAFSVLANYDRDLYKKFGLLAIDQDITEEKFLEYIKADFNAKGVGNNRIDDYLDADSIVGEMDKLYFLSQKEVFENQVNEFCAYRAPIAFVNNYGNVEELLKSLIKDLEESLSFLNMLDSLSKSADKTLKTVDKIGDLIDETDKYKKEIKKYTEFYDDYDTAIESVKSEWHRLDDLERERSRLIEEGAENIPEEPDWSSYYSACKEAADCANSLKSEITSLREEIDAFWNAFVDFQDAFKSMQEANVSSVFEISKGTKNYHDISESMQKSYKDSEDFVEKTYDMTRKFDQKYFTELQEKLSEDQEELEHQYIQLNIETRGLIEVSSVEKREFELKLRGDLDPIREMMVETLNQVETACDENSDVLNTTFEMLGLIVDLFSGGFTYDSQCVEKVSLPNALSQYAENDYAGSDEAYVNSLLSSSTGTKVSAALGYDLPKAGTTDAGVEYNELADSLNRFVKSLDNLKSAFNRVESAGWRVRKLVKALIEVMVNIGLFVAATIDALNNLIHCLTRDLMKVIYSKFHATTYATEMFSNRTTKLGDEKLNGEDMPNYIGSAGGRTFALANTEYILSGCSSEKENQIKAFHLILAFRLLVNVPGVFMNTKVQNLVTNIAATIQPFIGVVLAALLLIAFDVIESFLDMIFLIYGDGGVYIIKTDTYILSNKGDLKELCKQVKGLIGSNVYEKAKTMAGKGEKKKKKSTSEKLGEDIDDWEDSLLRWDYKQHLFLMLTFFTSSDKMYSREADLVQLQMDMEEPYRTFRLDQNATYIRTKTDLKYDPLLPIPKRDGIPMGKLKYTGY